MSTVIETTPRGDVEVETEASRARDARRDAETRARRDCEAARRRETRETCERLVTFLRVVATERGRGMETEVFGGNEGLKHRGRLLKLRVRVARVRMQPKRARRPANRVRESGDESVGGGGFGLRRQRSLAEMATRNAARLAGGGRAETPETPSGYGSDASLGTTHSEGEASSRLEYLLALLAHAPYEHESLEDGGRPRGWTGSGSTMSRTGVIRVGVDHQARVEATTNASFARGTMDAREMSYLGTLAWPPPTAPVATRRASSSSPVRVGTRPSALRGTKPSTTSRELKVEEKEKTGKEFLSNNVERRDENEDENKQGDEKKDENENEDEATTERKPLISEEDILTSRRALEDALRRSGVGDSLLGLATIGAAGARENWDEEETATFAEHVNKYCDDLFRLCVKLPNKTMRDVVNYYYNVWQVGYKNHGRVDVEGAEEPAHRERGSSRGRGRPRGAGAAPKFTSEEVRRERDNKTIRDFVDWIRGVAMNPKRAMLNVHRAPTTARFKEHMMTRWRGAAFDSSDGAKDFLKDLSRRMHAAKFTPEEREAARKVKVGVRRPGRPSKRAASAAEKRGAAPGAHDSNAAAPAAAKRGKKAKANDSGEDDDKADAENQKKKPTGKRTANTKKRTSNGLKTTDRNFIL